MTRYHGSYLPYELKFNFEAGTSRGVLKNKISYFIRISDEQLGTHAFGEVSPLPNLSIDNLSEIPFQIEQALIALQGVSSFTSVEEILDWVARTIPAQFPAIVFGFEMALLDLFHGGKGKLFDNDFFDLHKPIQINGLVWMGKPDFMKQQIQQKLDQGFSCIKMKIGAIDWEEEKRLLHFLRKQFSSDVLTLRVDANGAFDASNVQPILDELAVLEVHSIEQPIKPKQWELMADLCRRTPVPIALDEELIGVLPADREALLETILPQYLIFKPSLLGGVASTKDWIARCETKNIPWWMTSALESNVGLNAVAQMTAAWANSLPQGLGTGQIYSNNIPSPLEIKGQYLQYGEGKWEYPPVS